MNKLYNIYTLNSLSEISFIKKRIIKKLKKKNKRFNGDLSLLHKYFSKKKINSIRIDCFNEVNFNFKWEKMLKKNFFKELRNHLGSDIMMQSKLNLSIQMPNDKSSILGLHSDCWSADSPFQLNLWIPLTNAFKTNSMFIKDINATMNFIKSIKKKDKFPKNIQPSIKDFIKIDYGQYLIFNPALLHGNILNKTNKTRISLNIRFKSFFSPEPGKRNPDRKFGTHYKIFNLSKNTKFGMKYLKTGMMT